MPDVLIAAGLKVSRVPGFESRGRGDVGPITGVICHHTVGPKNGNMPSLDVLINGRTGNDPLPGPLANLGLGRDGTYFVIAAGRAIHAGKGNFKGVGGNAHFIGIEAENTGQLNDSPWPQVQLEAYHRGVAAILSHLNKDSSFCCGHKEFAPQRKIDPNFDMNAFRQAVASIISGTAPQPVLIPAVEPTPSARPTLRRGAAGDLVSRIQKIIGVTVDGKFGPNTEAAVRAFQRDHKLVPDGIVGPKTWAVLDPV
jgi:peptidoglycan hydrolase-like protein with peptidoglycan-binding domain